MADWHGAGQTSGIPQDTDSDPQTANQTNGPATQDNRCTEHVTSHDVITQNAPESELRRVKSYQEIDIQPDDFVEEATGAGADGDEEAGSSAAVTAVFIHGDIKLKDINLQTASPDLKRDDTVCHDSSDVHVDQGLADSSLGTERLTGAGADRVSEQQATHTAPGQSLLPDVSDSDDDDAADTDQYDKYGQPYILSSNDDETEEDDATEDSDSDEEDKTKHRHNEVQPGATGVTSRKSMFSFAQLGGAFQRASRYLRGKNKKRLARSKSTSNFAQTKASVTEPGVENPAAKRLDSLEHRAKNTMLRTTSSYILLGKEETLGRNHASKMFYMDRTASHVGAPSCIKKQKSQSYLTRKTIQSSTSRYHTDNAYKIVEDIGEGGYGKVQKVLHLRTGQLAAMKTVRLRGTENHLLASHKREVKTILRLKQHENIVNVMAIFHGKSHDLKMIMELCDEDLTSFMARKSNRDFPISLKVATQTAKGVMILHTQKPQIIHRDLKPQNVLISRVKPFNKLVAKLSDFGISSIADVAETMIDDVTRQREVQERMTNTCLATNNCQRGTRPFMSPEILEAIDGKGLKDGKFVFDASVDIFALGQVFNYIFCYNTNDYGNFGS